MPETLRFGSHGDEVRRLQTNLNAAIGKQYGYLIPDGKFGPLTKTAVERFQKHFKLRYVDGIVGPETRAALATRALIIGGTITRNASPTPPKPGPKPTPVPPFPRPPSPTASLFLLQLQPAFALTPPPFLPSGQSPTPIASGQLAMGIIYRTASEGPHWEFGGGLQPSFNTKNTSTDPRYSIQLQGSVAYADPWSKDRFHSQLFAQVVFVENFAPSSTILGAQLGGQISVDIIADRWNLFVQGVLAGTWVLHDDSGGQAGEWLLGPQFTLGSTLSWGL
jgi:hypothetical protein